MTPRESHRPTGVGEAAVHLVEARAGVDRVIEKWGRVDVLLLGMGPEGHVASIFPATPAVSDERPVVAVRDCPKPPPTRVSLGYLSEVERGQKEASSELLASICDALDVPLRPAAGRLGRTS